MFRAAGDKNERHLTDVKLKQDECNIWQDWRLWGTTAPHRQCVIFEIQLSVSISPENNCRQLLWSLQRQRSNCNRFLFFDAHIYSKASGIDLFVCSAKLFILKTDKGYFPNEERSESSDFDKSNELLFNQIIY